MRTMKIFAGFVLLLFCFSCVAGCETLRKKFTRKKKSPASQEAVIVSPRDYGAHPFPSDVMYKQYFAYWKSWNQELVSALIDRASDKKVLDCADQAVMNLKKMASYLQEEQANQLNVYVKKTEDLKEEMAAARAMLAMTPYRYRYAADRILSEVNRKFDFRHMKDFLR